MNLLAAVLCIVVFSNAPAAPKKDDLHRAVLDQDITLVKRLLYKGADINEVGSRSFRYGSALHLAIREGYVDIAKLLLDRGAEVDVLDPNDFTPLHNAAWNGNLDLVKLLLDAGADINASTYDGDTPLSLAQNNNQPDVAEFFQAKLQPSATSEVKVESVATNDTGVIDISGTYISETTGSGASSVHMKRQNRKEITLEQTGNAISGSDGSKYPMIFGTREGNTINYNVTSTFHQIEGDWEINADATKLEGKWFTRGGGGGSGIFNLTKIE